MIIESRGETEIPLLYQEYRSAKAAGRFLRPAFLVGASGLGVSLAYIGIQLGGVLEGGEYFKVAQEVMGRFPRWLIPATGVANVLGNGYYIANYPAIGRLSSAVTQIAKEERVYPIPDLNHEAMLIDRTWNLAKMISPNWFPLFLECAGDEGMIKSGFTNDFETQRKHELKQGFSLNHFRIEASRVFSDKDERKRKKRSALEIARARWEVFFHGRRYGTPDTLEKYAHNMLVGIGREVTQTLARDK